MQGIFDFLVKLFKLNADSDDFYNKIAGLFTGAMLTVVILAVITLALLITVIVLAVKNGNKKKRLKDNAAGQNSEQILKDNAETRNRIRLEIEPIVRKEVELEYKEKMPKSGVTDEQFERLKKRLDEKDARIAELGRALEQANAATHAISTGANTSNSEISKTVSDLSLQNGLLTEQNNQYHNQIIELQEEIARLKEQSGKQQAAAERAKQKAVEKAKADVEKKKETESKAAKEKAKKEAEEKAAKEAAEKTAKEVAEKAAKEAAEKAAKEAAEKAAKETAEKVAKETAAKAKKEAEEQAKKDAEEKAKKEAEEKAAKEKAETPAESPASEVDNEFGNDDSEIKVTLKYDEKKEDWVISRSDMTRAYKRCATKAEALPVARDLAKRLQAQLIVHNKDGKLSYNI